MKNKFQFIATLTIIFAVGLGCGLVDSAQQTDSDPEKANANKTLTDKAIDTAVGEKKIGIPECDEVADFFVSYADNPDDNFVIKAGKRTFINKMRDEFRKVVEEPQTDKAELAKTCKEFKKNLEIFKAEEENKQ